jgi:hypothetical protein
MSVTCVHYDILVSMPVLVFSSDTFFAKIRCVWLLSNRYIAVRHFLFGVSLVVIFVVVFAAVVVISTLCTRKRLGHYQYP